LENGDEDENTILGGFAMISRRHVDPVSVATPRASVNQALDRAGLPGR
jgi:hypothetical protein